MSRRLVEKYPSFRSFAWIHDQKVGKIVELANLSTSTIDTKRDLCAMYEEAASDDDFIFYKNNQVVDIDDVEDFNNLDLIYYITNFNPGDRIVLKLNKNHRENVAPWFGADVFLQSNMKNNRISTNSGEMLLDWAYLGPDIKEFTKDLKELALEENWDYGRKDSDSNGTNLILWNYLKYTFAKLWRDGKIGEGKNYAAFNTGLVDRKYEYIFAVFKQNPHKDAQPWRYEGFCVPGGRDLGKEFVRNFTKPFPEKATYFKDKYSMLYTIDPGKSLDDQEPDYDFEHVVLDNTRRLPKIMLEDCCFDDKEILNLLKTDITGYDIVAKNQYWKTISDLISENDRVFRRMKQTIDAAISLAIKRVDWNYKTAIPMYYPKRNIMSLLLPLSVVDEKNVDIALVVERASNGNYIGHTILTLDMAYSNARLVCKPESDWLKPENISLSGESSVIED